VEIASDRRYRFVAERAAVWAALGDVGAYRRWWPWLRRFEADGLRTGAVWRCLVQPPLPYTVRFDLRLQGVVEGERVEADVDGDVAGTAVIELSDHADGGCGLRLRSTLHPATRSLAAIAVVAGPVVRFGHDWLLDTGARQFERRGLGA
jgi:uncharacterized protein YndB with AHSA1/START domain